MSQSRISATDRVFEEMVERIQRGDWEVGSPIPSERDLMEEFGVSRIVMRECLSRMRLLGILDISHGRNSTVCKMDTRAFGQLFPLMLLFDGKESFENISEIRLALEWQTSYLAAQRRTDEDVARLDELVTRLRERLGEPLERASETDTEFHIQVARATQNPLFPLLCEVVAGFVAYTQVYHCYDNPVRRQRAVDAHELIAEAIKEGDGERARAAMETHLRLSASYVTRAGIFDAPVKQATS